jgi:hypothetical protein
MRKFLSFLLLLCSTLFLFNACRKSDASLPTETPDRFFNVPNDASPQAKAIAEAVKKQNARYHFLSAITTKAGYPKWAKAKIVDYRTKTISGRRVSDSLNGETVYIPFVLDSQNKTNAVLIVHMNEPDTSYRLLYARNYRSFGFDTANHTQWNARNAFQLFTNFDHSIFGHTQFRILDDRLFKAPSGSGSAILTLIPSQSPPVTGRSATFVEIEECTSYQACDPVVRMANGQDCVTIPVCTTHYVDLGGGGGTGGGGTGGGSTGGGSGSTGGGGSDDWWNNGGDNPCQEAGRMMPAAPTDCEVGWEPVPRDNSEYLITNLASSLSLDANKQAWLEDNLGRAIEIHNFLFVKPYDALTLEDKKMIARIHLDNMMTDADYLEMVESMAINTSLVHPWMIELFKELGIEIGVKLIKKFLPGYGDWQSVKQAIDDGAHGDFLSMTGEILNLVKKKVPLVAVFDLAIDSYNFWKLANQARLAFNKIQRIPTNAFNAFLKTLKNKCGGILEKIEHSSLTNQGVIKYNPSDAENFFKDLASGIPGVTLHSPAPGRFYFDVGDIRFTYYPTSTSTGGPTIELSSLSTNWGYKFRFQ